MSRIALAYDEAGAGDPWLFLHGFPFHRGMWGAQRELAQVARCLFVDLRGFGASPPGPDDEAATMDAMAEDVLALAEGLDIHRFGIVGFSMGGYVALALQRMAPRAVLGMALVDTQPGADAPAARTARRDLARDVEARGVDVLVEGFLPKLMGSKAAADPAYVRRVEGLARANQPRPLAEALRGMALRDDHTARLADIGVPVLCLAGDEDQVTPADKAAAMARALPDGRLLVIPGAGHLAPLEAPGLVNAALADHMAACRRSPPGLRAVG